MNVAALLLATVVWAAGPEGMPSAGARPYAPGAPSASASAPGAPAGPPLGAPRGGDLVPYVGILAGGVGALALALAFKARVQR